MKRKAELIRGLSYEEYSSIDARNFSTLKLLEHSPKHYQHNIGNATENDALRLGIAAHCAVLEPKRFASAFAIWDRRSEKTGNLCPRGDNQFYNEFLAENKGKTVLTENQQTDALTMQLAVSSCPEAMAYLAHGDPEVTMTWRKGKHLCKGRLDWLTDLGEGPVLVGLKTAVDIRLDQFSRTAARLQYHLQWPFYFDGYEAITGKRPHEIVEIVVEKKPPHDVVVYVIDDEVLEIGRAKYLLLLERLDYCQANNDWPGVGGGGKRLFQLPQWMYNDDDLTELGLEI